MNAASPSPVSTPGPADHRGAKAPPAPIAVHDLVVGFNSSVILHGISARIERGTCVAITGNNGSGKSTLVKAILGLAPVWSGSVDLYGVNMQTAPKRAVPWAEVGYVPQRNTIGGGISATVKEIVASGTLGPRRWWYSAATKRATAAALEQVGLLHRENEAFQVLSGGQQQRVLIARALVRQPDLVLMDEPLTGLDAHNRGVLADVLREHKDAGRTSVIVLHELGELAPLIDHELQISSGHLVHDGPCTHRRHEDPHHHFHHHQPPNEGPSVPRVQLAAGTEY